MPHVRIHVSELAPTQPTVGRMEVRLKLDRFALMSPGDTAGYLRDKEQKGKPVQVVRGPAAYYLVDGHHTMAGIQQAGVLRQVDVELVDDLSELGEPSDFWATMDARGHALLRHHAEPCSPDRIPRRLDDLEDDPYRTVAWLVRKMYAYEDLKRPYQEFEVADFLRRHMAFAPAAYHEYERAALHGFELLRSPLARRAHEEGTLDGFIDEPVPEDLLGRYYEVLATARAPRIYR